MTRQQMITRIAQRLGLTIGDSVYGDPFLVSNILDQVTDTFAGPGMDCFYDSDTTDLVAGQSEYCAPRAYKILGAYWQDAAGTWRILSPSTPRRMDQSGSSWRNASSGPAPRCIVFEGVNTCRLYPAPNFSLTGGLRFEGYMQTTVSGVSLWSALTAECPLPSWCHDAIVEGAAKKVAETMLVSDNPGEVARAARVLPSIQREYRMLRGKAEQAAIQHHQETVAPSVCSEWSGWRY